MAGKGSKNDEENIREDMNKRSRTKEGEGTSQDDRKASIGWVLCQRSGELTGKNRVGSQRALRRLCPGKYR